VIRAVKKEGGKMTVEISPDRTIRIVPSNSEAAIPGGVPRQGQIVL
jgi:hypothetical protein